MSEVLGNPYEAELNAHFSRLLDAVESTPSVGQEDEAVRGKVLHGAVREYSALMAEIRDPNKAFHVFSFVIYEETPEGQLEKQFAYYPATGYLHVHVEYHPALTEEETAEVAFLFSDARTEDEQYEAFHAGFMGMMDQMHEEHQAGLHDAGPDDWPELIRHLKDFQAAPEDNEA